MRALFLEALAKPIAELRAVDKKVDAVRESVALAREAKAQAEMAARVLETVSFGLTLTELLGTAPEEDDESDEDDEGGE
jgi:hypothetical protein